MSKVAWFTEEECQRAKRLREMGYSYQAIADRMKTNKGRIGKLAQRGFKRFAKQGARDDVPGDLSWRIGNFTFNECKAHYKVGATTLRRWLDTAGIAVPNRQRRAEKRPRPADFAVMAQKLSHHELQKHYRATGYVVTRWKLECGIPTPRHDLNARRAADNDRIGWAERRFAA